MLEQLLKNLNSRHEGMRQMAMREVRALPMETRLELFHIAFQRYTRQARTYRLLYWSLTIAILVLMAISISLQFIPNKFPIFGISLGLVVAFINATARTRQRTRNSLIRIVEATYDERLVVPTLLLLKHAIREDTGDSVRATLRDILKTLLPQLRLDEVRQWPKAHREALLVPLQKPLADVELTLRVLKMLEQVGEESAIPVVEKLASQPLTSQRIQQIRSAAQDCLPYLRARADKTQQSETLLRASDAAAAAAPDVLLRPAATHPDNRPSEQLLRPHLTEE